jgi:hypothetical protein
VVGLENLVGVETQIGGVVSQETGGIGRTGKDAKIPILDGVEILPSNARLGGRLIQRDTPVLSSATNKLSKLLHGPSPCRPPSRKWLTAAFYPDVTVTHAIRETLHPVTG